MGIIERLTGPFTRTKIAETPPADSAPIIEAPAAVVAMVCLPYLEIPDDNPLIEAKKNLTELLAPLDDRLITSKALDQQPIKAAEKLRGIVDQDTFDRMVSLEEALLSNEYLNVFEALKTSSADIPTHLMPTLTEIARPHIEDSRTLRLCLLEKIVGFEPVKIDPNQKPSRSQENPQPSSLHRQ